MRHHSPEVVRYRMQLAATLHRLTEEHTLSREEVARRAGVATTTIQKWFAGHQGPLRAKVVERVRALIAELNGKAPRPVKARPNGKPRPQTQARLPFGEDPPAPAPKPEVMPSWQAQSLVATEAYIRGFEDGYQAGRRR